MGWRRFCRRRFWNEERAREIQSYIEIETDDNVARGMPPQQARLAAHKKFGNGTYILEEIYRMNTIGFIESLWQDARHTFLSLCRNPGFAAAAIITLALGIGANLAVFNVADAMMFRPFPYRDSGRLVSISWTFRSAPENSMPSYLSDEIEDWRAQKSIFASVEPYNRYGNPGKTDSLLLISTGMLKMLGVQPKLGRDFLPEEGQPGRDQVVLISEGCWKRQFGADPSVIGKTVSFDDKPYTVIGVMPRDFEFPVGRKPDAWAPWRDAFNGTSQLPFFLMARLRPGVRVNQAQRAALLASDQIHFIPLLKKHAFPKIANLARSVDSKSKTALIALLFAVSFVFIIACVNVANIMLSRGCARQRETAIRAAIGASRARLARFFLMESFILSIAGGIAALILSGWTTSLIIAMLPSQLSPQKMWFYDYSPLNGRSFVFAGLISVLACLLCGLIPALRGARGSRISGLAETSRITSGTPIMRRLQMVFQSLQACLAILLLIGAGLMANSFMRIILTKPGFDTTNLWRLRLSLPSNVKGAAAMTSFCNQLKTQVASIPGVRSATISGGTPVDPYPIDGGIVPAGQPGAGSSTQSFYVTQDYFPTLGIPIVGGRSFNSEDSSFSTPITIIDAHCAEKFWPGQSPIGKQLRFNPRSASTTVVGVAATVKTGLFMTPDSCQFYKPFLPSRSAMNLVIRIDGNPGPVLDRVRLIAADLDPKTEISQTAAFDRLYAIIANGAAEAPRFYLILMLIFAAIALVTTTVGVYGVLSYSVDQRTSEIGLRMALGATARDIQRLLVRSIAAPVCIGIMMGVLASLWFTRFLRALLFEISPIDPATIVSVTAFLLLVSLVACFLPCRRATRLDPLTSLRVE